jgi:hypothetical protein
LSNIDPSTVAMVDLFFATNDTQAGALRRAHPSLRTETTGSARVDLIATATYPRPLAKPYILFNTSFAIVNSVRGSEEAALDVLVRGGLDPNAREGRKELEMRLGFERATFEDMKALIAWATDTLPLQTVVRPHPAENPRTWIESVSEKVKVVVGENPLPWIAGAELLVHANSTSGLEAAMLRRPCLNLSPAAFDGWTSQFLMGQTNATVRSKTEGAAAIERFFAKKESLVSEDLGAWFPPDGAARIARGIAAFMRERGVSAGFQGDFRWLRFLRSDVQRTKFTASKDEFAAGLNRLAPGLAFQIMELDDSVVLLLPSTKS